MRGPTKALFELMEISVGGQRVIGYPVLRDDGDSASLCVFDTPEEAQAVHAGGLLRLFRLHFREQVKYLEKNLPNLILKISRSCRIEALLSFL